MRLSQDTGIVFKISVTLKGSFSGGKALNTAYFIRHGKVPGWVTKRLPSFGYVDLELYFGPEIGNMYNAYSVSYNSTIKDEKRKDFSCIQFGHSSFTAVYNKCASETLLHTERHAMTRT